MIHCHLFLSGMFGQFEAVETVLLGNYSAILSMGTNEVNYPAPAHWTPRDKNAVPLRTNCIVKYFLRFVGFFTTTLDKNKIQRKL